MKKIISLLMVLLMLCSAIFAVACAPDDDDDNDDDGAKKTAGELVKGSLEKSQSLDCYHVLMTQNILIRMQGISMETPVTIEIMVEGANTDSPKIYSNQTVEMMGESANMELYIEGDYAYANVDGEKQKINLSEFGTDADNIMYNKTVEELLQVLPEDVLKDVKINTNDNGDKYVEVEFDPTKFLQIYEESIEGLSTELGVSIEDLTISDSKVKIVVDENGYVKEYTLTYKMSINVMGQQAEADVNLKMEFIEPGSPVAVSPMEDYLDYPSVN